jgi:hypothetical protein
MGKTIRFGGKPSIEPATAVSDNALTKLLGDLSWKHVKQDAEFDPGRSVTKLPTDELRQYIAHCAARV